MPHTHTHTPLYRTGWKKLEAFPMHVPSSKLHQTTVTQILHVYTQNYMSKRRQFFVRYFVRLTNFLLNVKLRGGFYYNIINCQRVWRKWILNILHVITLVIRILFSCMRRLISLGGWDEVTSWLHCKRYPPPPPNSIPLTANRVLVGR